jgi:predicted transport protein
MADKVDAAMATMVRNLEEKTGKTMAQWVGLVRALGPLKHGEIVRCLKETHELGHGYANLVAHTAAGLVGDEARAEADLVSAQYAGDKAALRPMYDQLIAAASAMGTDVEVSPKKTYVSLRRSKQFALIQPTTRTRIDVGLNLKGVAPDGRLEASGSFNAMCTHRVRVESAQQIDKALIGWLKDAYNKA